MKPLKNEREGGREGGREKNQVEDPESKFSKSGRIKILIEQNPGH
jgi:hypothetical protein